MDKRRLAVLAALAFLLELSGPTAAWARAYSDSEIRSVQSGDDAKIREIRNQEIQQLRLVLGRRLPSNRRADLYFRLAEIYLEAYRAEFLLEGRAHEKRVEQGVEDRTIDRSRSKPYLSAGLKACQELLHLGIPFSKMDQVYYFLGVNYGELDRRKESLQAFETLVRRYPRSPYVIEAYKELGDAAFEQASFRKAQQYYELAARHDQGDTLARILHKLAWTYYRTKNYGKAVEVMKQAVARADQSGEKLVSLKEEALRDMALFMTEGGRVDEAIDYFQRVAGDRGFYPRVLERLGKQYERNAQLDKAIQVYESLLKTHPEDEAAFRVRAKLVDLDLRRGRPRDALGRLKGATIFTSGDGDTMTAAQNLRAMIRRTATENHEKYRKKGDRGALSLAEDFYAVYLNPFLAKDDARHETPEIRMYLADVKRELGKSKEASELYRLVVDSGDKRYAKEAGALWTASLADAIKKQGKGRGQATEAPSEIEQEFVKAADDMQDSLGDQAEGREAALKAAQVLAGYRSTQKDAIKRCQSLMEKQPRSAQALTAARLWLQLLTDRWEKSPEKDREDAADELKDGLKETRENQALMAFDREASKGQLNAQLADLDTRVRVGAIAAQEKKQDFSGAAKGYEQFANEQKSQDLAEKAYANAVSAYTRDGDSESVERVVDSWLKRYPQSKKPVETVRSAATAALIQGRFDGAARMFERLGRGGNDREALETAARLYEGNGDVGRSRMAWDGVINQYKSSPDRFPAALAIALSYEAERTSAADGSAAKFYRYCLESPHDVAAECGARLADLYARAQDMNQAKDFFRRVAQLKKGKGAQSPYVAYARYRLAELLEGERQFPPLRMPEAQMKAGLNQRLEFLEPLSRAYLSAVEAGGPWAIAALDRLAQWATRFAAEVDAIEPPKGADAAKFRASLRSVSDPLRKKASDTWLQAYDKATSSEILSPALPSIADRLADGGTGRFARPRAQGYRGRLRLAGISADGGDQGRKTALEKTRERLTRNAQDASAWVDYGNLLWGEGKPGLARLAYERALALDPRSAAALNNRGVISASGSGEEDWVKAAEANALFAQALAKDSFFLAAKMNRAALLNYYRLFAKARPVWEQVLTKAQGYDSHDGLAIALQGMGDLKGAEAAFRRGTDAGGDSKRFSAVYHEAARQAQLGTADGAKACLSRVDDLDGLNGFEKAAAEHLTAVCKERTGDKG